jgi:hypothetical protein
MGFWIERHSPCVAPSGDGIDNGILIWRVLMDDGESTASVRGKNELSIRIKCQRHPLNTTSNGNPFHDSPRLWINNDHRLITATREHPPTSDIHGERAWFHAVRKRDALPL